LEFRGSGVAFDFGQNCNQLEERELKRVDLRNLMEE